MAKIIISFITLSFVLLTDVSSQKITVETPDTGIDVYLLTIDPGIETYSHYGHSALRVKIHSNNIDVVYNWGVFDFSTPNFAWKFAKGKLDYMLVADSFERFISQYVHEKRSVYQQKVNLDQKETEHLLSLISENMKPENVKYRYDFFYDDCSTRIRDLFEKIFGDALVYPEFKDRADLPTFRDKVGEYQRDYPWLNAGIDLLFGLSAYRKASVRDQMFLPFDLQSVLSETTILKGRKLIPLLRNPETIIKYPLPQHKRSVLTSPLVILGLLLILVIIISATYRGKGNRIIDIVFFTAISVLSVLMIFFNFFSDHEQLKWNMNILWLNPVILLCLVSLLLGWNRESWFRIAFFLALIILVPMFFMPAVFNNAFIPLNLIIILRSSMWAGFSWNPFSLQTEES